MRRMEGPTSESRWQVQYIGERRRRCKVVVEAQVQDKKREDLATVIEREDFGGIAHLGFSHHAP